MVGGEAAGVRVEQQRGSHDYRTRPHRVHRRRCLVLRYRSRCWTADRPRGVALAAFPRLDRGTGGARLCGGIGADLLAGRLPPRPRRLLGSSGRSSRSSQYCWDPQSAATRRSRAPCCAGVPGQVTRRNSAVTAIAIKNTTRNPCRSSKATTPAATPASVGQSSE